MFSFENDASWGYSHVYDDYIAIVNTNWAVSPAGNSYSFEFGTCRLGVQFVKIVKSLSGTNPSGHLYRAIPTSLYRTLTV